MAGTLAFSKFVVKDIFRNKGRTFSSIIGVVLAVSLIAGENIALDTTARDVLAQELKDYDYDFEGVTDTFFDLNDFASISDEMESIKGVKKAIALSQVNEHLEIHNESTITPPIYGYYERTIEVDIPVNGTIWLNTTLEQIPNDTYKLFGYVSSQITGEPIDNAFVEVYEGSVSSNGYYNETNTDENGYYEFYLPEAKYIIEVAADPSIQTSELIEINSSFPEKQLDFHIMDFENSKVKGYLIDSETGKPYNKTARMEVWNSSTGYSNSSWIYDGYFEIDIIFGNHTIFGWEYYDYKITNITELEIWNNTTTWLNLTLNPSPVEDVVISGHVYNKETGEPVRSKVGIKKLENYYYSYNFQTNLNGYFEVDSISGNLFLRVIGDPPSRDVTYETYEADINATSGQTIDMDIYLTPINSRIRGDAFTTEGDVIDSARLNVDGSSVRKTYHDGYYGWDVSAGTHNISFDASPSEVPIYHKSNLTSVFGMVPDSKTIKFLEETYQFKIIEGSFELGDEKTVISEMIANRYNLKVGDTINILLRNSYMDVINDTYVNDNRVLNYTVSGIVSWEDPGSPRFFNFIASHAIFLEYTDFESFYSSIAEIEEPLQVNTNVMIRIDRDKIIDPLNQDTTDFAITRLLTKVHTVALIKYDMRVDYLIEVPLLSYFSWYNSYRIQILAYALPVVAVGFYMGMVGIELAMAQKRRSLGIIKSRGASDKQIFTSLILESVILGIIAGTVGLILGVFVSRIFLTIIPGSRNIAADLDFFKLNISAGSIFWAVVFAVLLMLFASIKPAKRISKTPVIESLHQHTDVGSKKEYKPALDIFLVSFAIFAFIIVSEVNIGNLNPADLGQLFTILIVVTYLISVIWLPFSPFFLMFSLTRLLTRGTNRGYRFFSRMVKPFAKDLWYIIHKNLTRNPKKVSMISIIIALALGFGIFMTTMIATNMNGEELKIKTRIGGDLNVRTFRVNLSFGENLEEVEGVEDVVALNHMYGDMISGGDFESRKIAIFNATKYGESIDVDEYYFVEGSKKDALKALSQGNSVIIGENIAQFYSIKVGDMVRIDNPYISESGAQSGNKEVTFNTNNFKVAGVVRALPGLEDPFDDDFASWGGLVYLDFAALTTDISDVETGWIYLITVENGVDSKEVENEIDENYASNIGRIENLDTEISDIRNDMPTRSILFIMLVDIGFMIIIITVGLGLIMFISISERKNEFATIMARGAESKQMLVIILGEALSITMVGVVVGISSGLFTAYTFNKMISTSNLFGASGGTLSGRPLIIPWYGILVVLLALAALFATSLLAAYRVKRIKLHSALRIRGG